MSSATPAPKINYAGNSKLDKEIAAEEAAKSEPRLKKFEGVNVVQSKPTLGKRFLKSFGGQNLKAVAVAVLLEVVVPNAKDLLFDIVNEGAQRSIYGENGRRRTSSSALAQTIVGGGVSRMRGTNYNSISNQTRIIANAAPAQSISDRERQQFDFSNVIFPTRDHAEEVLETLKSAVEDFGWVPVADLFEALEISGNGFTDRKFGWNAHALSGSKVHKVREGFILLLEPPVEAD
jgi:hypothetical protein